MHQGENTQALSGPSQKLDLQTDEDIEDSEEETEAPVCKKARLVKGKEKETPAAFKKEGPVQLLGLPLDILKDILKEVGKSFYSVGELRG